MNKLVCLGSKSDINRKHWVGLHICSSVFVGVFFLLGWLVRGFGWWLVAVVVLLFSLIV